MKKYLYKGQIVTASSKEEAKVIADSKYTVWVGGTEVTDKKLTKSEAEKLAKKYEKDGYDDVVVEEVTASSKETKQVVANKETEQTLAEFVLVPTSAIVNKSWLLRFKKMYILDETKVAIQNKLKAPRKASTIMKMNKYILNDEV